MTLAGKLTEDMKAALRAGDKFRLGALRMALAAVKQQEVDTRKPLTDADVVRVLEKLIKRGRDAESQFRAGGRDEQADKEAGEVAIFSSYLPAQMDAAELDRIIADAIESTGAAGPADMGKIMGVLKQKAQGRVDMAVASKRVQELLRRQ